MAFGRITAINLRRIFGRFLPRGFTVGVNKLIMASSRVALFLSPAKKCCNWACRGTSAPRSMTV
jgi:hypothetical protein